MDDPRLALIGFGAIGRQLAGALATGSPVPVGAVLVRSVERRDFPPGIRVFTKTEDLLAWQPSLVVECAGHEAVRTAVPRVLRFGVATVLASVGALADPELQALLNAARREGSTRLTLISGAIGSLDCLAAAANAPLTRVLYVGSKPPAAWHGTPAERVCDLDSLEQPTVVFEGDAREAAQRFPKNANVAAAVALAGVGFERTEVRLVADPSLAVNRHQIEAVGSFGSYHFRIDNAVSPENPKSSWLTALSLEQVVREQLALQSL